MLEKLPFEIREAHLAGCKRGELLLSHDEILQLNKFLESRNEDGPQWRFVSVPASSRGLKLPAFSAVNPVAKATSHVGESAKRQLPEWAGTFQRMLNKFLQSELSKPFADRLPHVNEPITLPDTALHDLKMPEVAAPSATVRVTVAPPESAPITRHSLLSQHQKEIYIASQPHPGILSPKQILQRIENGEYTHCLDAFNDLYNYFLCGFRHYPPASPHWMLLHNVVGLFFTNLSSFPLKDNFDGPPSVIKLCERRSERRTKAERKPGVGRHSESHRHHHQTPENACAASRATADLRPEDMPIKRKETRALHRILQALSPELHQMLYDAFKDKAVWKTAESGQVQLNEKDTSAPVFRELLNWGASRVTWQVSSSSNKKKQLKLNENRAVTTASDPPPLLSAGPAGGSSETETGAATVGGQRYEDWLSSSDPDKAANSSSSSDSDSSDDGSRSSLSSDGGSHSSNSGDGVPSTIER